MSLLKNTDAVEVIDRYSSFRLNHPPRFKTVTPDRYLEFSIQAAESLDKDPAYHAQVAAPFVAMELCVGLWFGFMHYGFIGPDQYGRLTKQTPRKVLEKARYADALIRWWQQEGYPYITAADVRLGLRRRRLFDATAPVLGKLDDAIAHHRGVQAIACRAIRVGRGLASTAQLDELCAGVRSRHGCVTRHRSHVTGSCILCAFPVAIEVVADGPESSRHPAHGASGKGWKSKRSKHRADDANQVGSATGSGQDRDQQHGHHRGAGADS